MYKFNFYHTRPENFFRNDRAEQTKGLVGYLRGDFGRDGKEFHHTWFNNNEKLNNAGFKEDLGAAVRTIRGIFLLGILVAQNPFAS